MADLRRWGSVDPVPFRFGEPPPNLRDVREAFVAELERIRERHAAAAAAGYPTMPQEELSPLERLALLGEPDTPPGEAEAVERLLQERVEAAGLRLE